MSQVAQAAGGTSGPALGAANIGDLRRWLADGRLSVTMGPLVVRMQSRLPDAATYLHRAYANHPYTLDPPFADFHVSVRTPRNLRRWFRGQVEFAVDGEMPFEPLPREQAAALLEWGLNWSIAASCHQWLMIHAASLERNGSVVVLPAPPGSGKSTLCAALALRGWRLLSDELTLIDPISLAAHALARPINLKNASIELIRAFEPAARWGPVTYDTVKGRVAHLCPPQDAVHRMHEVALPRWIVFPRFEERSEPVLLERSKTATFSHFATNAFNYGILGEAGFDATWRLVDRCSCYDFSYSRLSDALEVFDWLSADPNESAA